MITRALYPLVTHEGLSFRKSSEDWRNWFPICSPKWNFIVLGKRLRIKKSWYLYYLLETWSRVTISNSGTIRHKHMKHYSYELSKFGQGSALSGGKDMTTKFGKGCKFVFHQAVITLFLLHRKVWFPEISCSVQEDTICHYHNHFHQCYLSRVNALC